jgi:hypothetical protein
LLNPIDSTAVRTAQRLSLFGAPDPDESTEPLDSPVQETTTTNAQTVTATNRVSPNVSDTTSGRARI